MGRKLTNLEDKFIENSKELDPVTGCVNWTGSMATTGYGQMYQHSKEVLAHRYSYMRANGINSLRSDEHICHRCDNTKCVNPDHLFLGTAADNMKDKMKKGRHRYPVGIEHGMAKLSEKDILAIRESNGSAEYLGNKYDVHPQHIRLIRRKKRVWLHV